MRVGTAGCFGFVDGTGGVMGKYNVLSEQQNWNNFIALELGNITK